MCTVSELPVVKALHVYDDTLRVTITPWNGFFNCTTLQGIITALQRNIKMINLPYTTGNGAKVMPYFQQCHTGKL